MGSICKMPVIESSRFILRPIELRDAQDMFEYASNEEVTRYMTWNAHKTLEETQLVIKNFFLKKLLKNQPEALVIEWKENHKMIGTCDLVDYDSSKNCVSIGYALNPLYWGLGIMTEACQIVLDLAFSHLNVDYVEITHHIDNIASQRVVEKNKFIFVGTERIESINKLNNELRKCYVMTKEDYFNMKGLI